MSEVNFFQYRDRLAMHILSMKMILLFTVVSAAFCGLAALGKDDDKPRTTGADESSTIRVRYIVNDVQAAVAFYTNNLQFHVTAQAGRNFAIVVRDNLQLVLSPPKGPGGASQPMPDGRRPEPGGWNRIILPSPVMLRHNRFTKANRRLLHGGKFEGLAIRHSVYYAFD